LMSSSTWPNRYRLSRPICLFPLNFNYNALLDIFICSFSHDETVVIALILTLLMSFEFQFAFKITYPILSLLISLLLRNSVIPVDITRTILCTALNLK
jgi:hypothetical protein